MLHIPQPACPGCAKPMTPVRKKGDAATERRSFHCRDCGTRFSEMASLRMHTPDRVLTLNFQAVNRPH